MSVRIFFPRIDDGECFTENEVPMTGNWVGIGFKRTAVRIVVFEYSGNSLRISLDGVNTNWIIRSPNPGGTVYTANYLEIPGLSVRRIFLNAPIGTSYVLNVFYSKDPEP